MAHLMVLLHAVGNWCCGNVSNGLLPATLNPSRYLKNKSQKFVFDTVFYRNLIVGQDTLFRVDMPVLVLQ